MDIISGFMRADRERYRLEELKEQFNTAKKLGLKKCNKCGFCCHRRTCAPTPEELKKIANFLKLTPTQLINKYYAIDRLWLANTYYVKPIGINQKDLRGKFIPSDRTFNEGKCIFLDKNNLCKIYPVRPNTAKICKCWSDKEYDPKDINSEWKGDKLKEEFGINGSKEEYKSK